MRPMASDTAVHLTCLMFEQERATLVHMTLETGLLVIVRLVQHFRGLTHPEGRGEAAVRVMAVAALHKALVHPVLKRQIELRAHIGVTLVTSLGLALREQILWRSRIVNRMTASACDIVLRVFRTPDVGPAEFVCVAGQAYRDDLFGPHDTERIDHGVYVAACVDMRLAWSVA